MPIVIDDERLEAEKEIEIEIACGSQGWCVQGCVPSSVGEGPEPSKHCSPVTFHPTMIHPYLTTEYGGVVQFVCVCVCGV